MSSSKSAKIWRRTQVGSSLAAVLTLLLWTSSLPGGEYVVLTAGSLLAFWALFEVSRMDYLRRPGLRTRIGIALVLHTLALLGLISWLGSDAEGAQWTGTLYWGMTLLPPVVAVVLSLPWGRIIMGRVHLSVCLRGMWLAPWLAVPLPALVLVRSVYGTAGLVALMILSKLGDIAGYYVGNAIGKTHPFPNLSKGKTTAGCVGSLIAGTLAGAACQAAGLMPEPRFGLLSGLLAGALLNLAAQAGDLLESYVKRGAEIKDSGTTFGPSGGLLDLVDSLLLTVPTALILWPVLYQC